MLRVEREDDVVADAVHGRVEAGEDRGVGGARQRHRALRVLEARAAGGQPVEVGVRRRASPYAPTWSARRVSIVTRSRLGRGERWLAHQPRARPKAARSATAIETHRRRPAGVAAGGRGVFVFFGRATRAF